MKEEWQFQPGMGSLGCAGSQAQPPRGSAANPRASECVECTRDDGRHLIPTILFGHTG